MTRESLIEAGIDYDQGVHRFAGRAQIFEKYLLIFFDGNMMDTLRGQLQTGSYELAFHTAHDLKGATGNLSLTALYKTICQMVEILRTGMDDGTLSLLFEQAAAQYALAEKSVKG